MIEVTIAIKRDGEAQPKVYQLKELGESKKGTFKTFAPAGENADLPEFSKVYVKVARDKEKSPKSKK